MPMMTTDQTVRALTSTSPVYRARTLKALTETCEMLAKEMRYSPEMRNQERLTFLNGHIAYLNSVLA